MTGKNRLIPQAEIFDRIGTPRGYEGLGRLQKHYMRHDARLKYERMIDQGHSHERAAHIALEEANRSALYYTRQNQESEKNRTCGANAKRSCKPCRMKPLPGRARCKFHGGKSTGPKSLEGKIKALSGLVQYRKRPDLLADRIERLRAEHRNYFETEDATPERA